MKPERNTNSGTEHSKALRQKTAKERNQRIVSEGGKNIRALVEKEYHDKWLALISRHSQEGKPITTTDLLKKLIDQAHKGIPVKREVRTMQGQIIKHKKIIIRGGKKIVEK